MESVIVKIVRIEFEESLVALNDPIIGMRYLYARKEPHTKIVEGQIVEITQSGAWIKLFNGQTAEWVHVEDFDVFERLPLTAR